MRTTRSISTLGLVLLALVLAACGGAAQPTPTATATLTPTQAPATPTPTPVPSPEAFPAIPGVVDPTNLGWPREVEGLNGRVTVEAKPQRILTVSLGHDEMTFALVPRERVIATSIYTKDVTYSNVADLAAGLPDLTRDAELIASFEPDIVIASPFAPRDFLDALAALEITVLQTDLHNDPEGRIQDVLLMGYAFGEEERALELAGELRQRHEALLAVTNSRPESQRPRVLALTFYGDSIYTAGEGSTEGHVIEAAGGINVAAEAGLEHNPVISMESIIAMAPEVIILPQPDDAQGGAFKQRLMTEEALSQAPAVRNNQVHFVSTKLFTTLSFWNLRGAEELARLLWPEDLGDMEYPPFSMPE